MDRLKESQFAKLLHEYVDTYVKYKDADNTEKIRLWLLLGDEAKKLFLYFSKLQKDNDALKRRIETLQIYADDYWERLKAHRKITRSLNARIDELEGAKCETCVHYVTDSYKFYSYPCSECKHRSRDSYMPLPESPKESEK